MPPLKGEIAAQEGKEEAAVFYKLGGWRMTREENRRENKGWTREGDGGGGGGLLSRV